MLGSFHDTTLRHMHPAAKLEHFFFQFVYEAKRKVTLIKWKILRSSIRWPEAPLPRASMRSSPQGVPKSATKSPIARDIFGASRGKAMDTGGGGVGHT